VTRPSSVLRPWQYPDCPHCGTEIYVSGSPRRRIDWVCYNCGSHFDDDDDGKTSKHGYRPEAREED